MLMFLWNVDFDFQVQGLRSAERGLIEGNNDFFVAVIVVVIIVVVVVLVVVVVVVQIQQL